MRLRIPPDCSLENGPMIVVQADNDVEVVLLRWFVDACYRAGGVQFGSHGGNPREGVFSFNIIPKYSPKPPAAGPGSVPEPSPAQPTKDETQS